MDDLFVLGCTEHRTNLQGTPMLKVKQKTVTHTIWEWDLSAVRCPTGKTECEKTWRVWRD